MSTRPLVGDKEPNVVSDGDDRSVLLVQVHRKHHFGKNELVGGFSDTIGGILGRLKDGGTIALQLACSADAIAMVKVLEVTIGPDASDGPNLSGCTIKFALAAEPRADVSSDERQALGAVAMATDMAATLRAPAVVEPSSLAIDAATNVMIELQTFETTWDVLLRRVELFNKIVADVAQVVRPHCHHRSCSQRDADSPIRVPSLVRYINCNQGLPVVQCVIDRSRCFIQLPVDQKNRDDAINRLARTMSDVFAFVEDAETLKRVEANVKTITLLTQQVTECAYFITEYTKQRNFCQLPPD